MPPWAGISDPALSKARFNAFPAPGLQPFMADREEVLEMVWNVLCYEPRNRLRLIGRVEAPDLDAARRAALSQFPKRITSTCRCAERRMAARRTGNAF